MEYGLGGIYFVKQRTYHIGEASKTKKTDIYYTNVEKGYEYLGREVRWLLGLASPVSLLFGSM